MSDDLKERISALLDNELQDGSSELLSRVAEDGELRQAWERYHLIGDAMRGESFRLSQVDLAERIRCQIEADPAQEPAAGTADILPLRRHRWQLALGGALAASVALVTVISVSQVSELNNDSSLASSEQTTVPISAEPPSLEQAHWKRALSPQVESKLNRYLANHNEFASGRGMPGVLPYTSFVSYGREQ